MDSMELEKISDDIREIKNKVTECSNEGNSTYFLIRDRMDNLEATMLQLTEILTEIRDRLPSNCTFPKGVGLTQDELEGSDLSK